MMTIYELTEREKDVYYLLVSELTTPEILSRLNVARCTLRTHANNIYQKLCVNSRFQLAVKHYQNEINKNKGVNNE